MNILYLILAEALTGYSDTYVDPVFKHGMFSIAGLCRAIDVHPVSRSVLTSTTRNVESALGNVRTADSSQDAYPLISAYVTSVQQRKVFRSAMQFAALFAESPWWAMQARVVQIGLPKAHDFGLTEKQSLDLYSSLQALEQHASSDEDELEAEFRQGARWLRDTLGSQALDGEITRLRDQQLSLEEEAANLFKTGVHADYRQLLASLASAGKLRDQRAHLSGYPNYATLEMKHSALGDFERSKNRSGVVTGADDSPVAGVYREVWHKVISPHMQWFNTVTTEEVRQCLSGSSSMPLWKALQGFAIVAHGLLNLSITVDNEQGRWSPTSIVLRVERNGELLGRIFAEFSNEHDANFILPARCSARSNGEPGIVLLSVSRKALIEDLRGRVKSEEGSEVAFLLESTEFSAHRVGSLFHELAHALHCLGSDIQLPTSTIAFGEIDYLELPSTLFESFARDWVDFSSGMKAEDTPSVSSSNHRVYAIPLILAMSLHYATKVQDVVSLKSLFDEKDKVEISPSQLHSVLETLLRLSDEWSYGHAFAHPLSLMVYAAGGYRSKLFGLFDQAVNASMVSKNEGFNHGSFLSLDTSNLRPLDGEDRMRRFFELGITQPSFRTFFQIVPTLEQKLVEASYLEDAIDFTLWAAELTRAPC